MPNALQLRRRASLRAPACNFWLAAQMLGSSAALAGLLGTSEASVSRYIAGRQQPSARVLQALADYLQVHVKDVTLTSARDIIEARKRAAKAQEAESA